MFWSKSVKNLTDVNTEFFFVCET